MTGITKFQNFVRHNGYLDNWHINLYKKEVVLHAHSSVITFSSKVMKRYLVTKCSEDYESVKHEETTTEKGAHLQAKQSFSEIFTGSVWGGLLSTF